MHLKTFFSFQYFYFLCHWQITNDKKIHVRISLMTLPHRNSIQGIWSTNIAYSSFFFSFFLKNKTRLHLHSLIYQGFFYREFYICMCSVMRSTKLLKILFSIKNTLNNILKFCILIFTSKWFFNEKKKSSQFQTTLKTCLFLLFKSVFEKNWFFFFKLIFFVFLYYFDVLMLKIKKYYFNIFSSKT